MKVKVRERFVGKGRVVHYPGEIISVDGAMARKLIQRRIVKPIEDEGQPFETTAAYARQAHEQWAREGCCP